MKIGELARKAAVNIQTLRFYERERLLRVPMRTASGYRIYENRDLERVRFIRLCQGLGFTLREIRELAHLHEALSVPQRAQKSHAVDAIALMANERLVLLDKKIRALKVMRSELARLGRALTKKSPALCPGAR